MEAENHAGADEVKRATGTAEMYRLAYDEGKRALEDQRDELNAVRTRAVTFMAFIGTATAFLVGTGLGSTKPRAPSFHEWATAGTVSAIVALVMLLLVLFPRFTFRFVLQPGPMVESWIEREVPKRPTDALLLRHLALRHQKMINANRKRLTVVRWGYLVMVLAGAVALGCWSWLAWLQN